MPYSVILVDDEPWSIIDLTHSVDWESTGFCVIGTYENPREAADAIVAQKPDVVFTDIKMPGLDGFALIAQCRETGASSEFVILSSYSDFCYAQQAIKSAVVEYCLKPIDPDDLGKLLRNLSARLDEKNGISKAEAADDFMRILEYVKANYQKKLLLSTISDLFSFHRNYICHLFQKRMNLTFSAYVNTLRIATAKNLLAHTNMSVEEIADNVGIDYYYFNKLFKKETQETPTAYRKNSARRSDGFHE